MRKFFSLVTTCVKGLHARREEYPRTALRAVGEGTKYLRKNLDEDLKKSFKSHFI